MPVLQTKLEVGAPNDRFEQEAERVADQVMRVPENVALAAESAPAARTRGYVQRVCDECAEETARLQRMPLPAAARISSLSASMMARSALPDRAAGVLQRQDIDEDETLQAKAATGAAPDIMPGVEARIHALRGRGQPLSSDQSAFFEPRFGHDFGEVRIHTDTGAADSARALNARAYTIGTHIVFGSGQLAAGTHAGRRLLAHELTHVVQQQGGAPALQRQQIQPTCNGLSYDPARQCCCHYRVIPGPCAPPGGCVDRTTRDNEYDGCSVPAWLEHPEFKDNPGLASDTWFSDRRIHGTHVQDSFHPQLPCDVHDKCYQTCSGNPEGHWRACDQQLFTDAEAVCERHKMAHGEDYNYSLCIDAARKAKRLLPLGSWGSFEERQREYCACCPPPDVRDAMPIYFDTDSDVLDSGEIAALKLFVEEHRALLASGAFDYLTLSGHASRIGDEGYNLDLSKRRIAAVRAAMENLLGAPLSGVDEFPWGEEEAEGDRRPDEENAPEDRRVDITIAGGTP